MIFLTSILLDKDFELCQMDTNSFYLAMSGDCLDEVVKPEIRRAYELDKKNWLVKDEFSVRTLNLFNPEFVVTRGVWLTSKCYLKKKDQEK